MADKPTLFSLSTEYLSLLELVLESVYVRDVRITSRYLIPFLNKIYGLYLNEFDVVSEVFSGGSGVYRVRIEPNSLLYVGSLQVKINFLESLVDQRYLSGFSV